jgi:hypothetical protein
MVNPPRVFISYARQNGEPIASAGEVLSPCAGEILPSVVAPRA